MDTRNRRCTVALAVFAASLLSVGLFAQAVDHPDLNAIYKIKDEGFKRSQVMEVVSYLTDVYGPRLTGSPNLKAAGEYTKKKFTEWGLVNAHFESWGPFGRGWTNDRFSAQAIAPQAYPIIAYPKAWTPSTNGTVTAEAIFAPITTEKDLDTYHGKLKGKFVLTEPLREVKPIFDAPAHLFTDAELADLAHQPNPAPAPREGRIRATPERLALEAKKVPFYLAEGVVALIQPGGDGGTVFVQSGAAYASGTAQAKSANEPPVPPQIVMATEQYGRIMRTLEKEIPVTLELNIKNTFYDAEPNSFNVLGEIPGTDKADEVVMLGGHLDSWHVGTGATDNAAGATVMMETMRILKATGLKMRRTVRIGLWSGEEQEMLGSKAYVKEHFYDPATGVKPEHAKLSAYFNLDNGTGAIRGVYLYGNEAVAPIFEAWMQPFRNMGMTTLAIGKNGGATDHISFDAAGLPGFEFIQDPVELDTRTHHSNMDVYERIQAGDLMQNAVIVASFVYTAANRDQLMPRKPMPKPRPQAAKH